MFATSLAIKSTERMVELRNNLSINHWIGIKRSAEFWIITLNLASGTKVLKIV